ILFKLFIKSWSWLGRRSRCHVKKHFKYFLGLHVHTRATREPLLRSFLIYVGIFRKKYTPRKPKIASGDQAASIGGSWPTEPIASNSAAVAQYTIATPTATASPPTAPRVPVRKAKGAPRKTIIPAINGKANFFCHCTESRAVSNPACFKPWMYSPSCLQFIWYDWRTSRRK